MKDFSKFSFLLLLFAVIFIGCGESSGDDSSAGERTESNEGSNSGSSFGEMKGTEVENLIRPFYNAAKNMNGELGDNAIVYLTVPDKYGMSSVECSFKGTDNLDKIVIDEDNGTYSTLSIKGNFDSTSTVNLKSESSMSVSITMIDCELIGVK